MIEFKEFPKIHRLNREIIITEKIDGTNAQIFIGEDGSFLTGSRSQWITPEQDNHGFARWANEHKEDLMTLGPGSHYGEWWGLGIQRNYGLKEKRFSLFNVFRWTDDVRPACCGIVPTLYTGLFKESAILAALTLLRMQGSIASPGFMKPEGIVIYHTQGRFSLKVTLEKDDEPKSIAGKP